MMSTWLHETCRELEQTIYEKELCVKCVIDCNKMHGQKIIEFPMCYLLAYLTIYWLISRYTYHAAGLNFIILY